jgi:MFS family permease
MITVAYVDRMIMSMAGPVLAKEFGLSPLSLGTLYSSFLWGYAGTMLLAGWLVDRLGARIMIPLALVAVVALSLAMVTTAITLTFALTSDLIIDESSAGRSFSILSFAGQIMGLLAPIITGWIVGKAGFTPVFIVTAGLVRCGTIAVLTLPTRQLQPRQRA